MADPSSPEFQEPQGISLNELTQAYAHAMGSDAHDPPDGQPPESPEKDDRQSDVAEESPRDTIPIAEGEESDQETAGDSVAVSPLSVVETLLFVGSIDNQPLESTTAAQLMRGVTPGDVAELIDELNARYRSNGCPYKIVGDGSGYRMTLRQAFYPVRNKFYG